MSKCNHPRCEDGWIWAGDVIGFIPCNCSLSPEDLKIQEDIQKKGRGRR